MKKTILFLIILLLNIKTCKAYTLTEKLPQDKNIVISGEVVKYKWYKLKKVNERINNFFEHNCEYFEQVESEFGPWSEKIPLKNDYRIIEEKEEINKSEFDLIFIEDFKLVSLFVNEIKIYDSNNEALLYNLIICKDCVDQLSSYTNLNDGNYNTGVTINSNSQIVLKLDKPHIGKFSLNLYFEKKDKIFGFSVTTVFNEKWVKHLKFDKENLFYIDSGSSLKGYRVTLDTQWNYNPILIKKSYRYKDAIIKCFDYKKEYIDGYYEYMEGYSKDEASKAIFYKYKEATVKKEIIEKIQYMPLINDENEKVASNYNGKKEEKKYSKVPIFIIILGSILIFLVLICRRIGKNIKESR